MSGSSARRSRSRVVVLAVLGALLAAAAFVWSGDRGHTTVHVHFTSAEGLNVDDDVKVLGVSVGRVTAIENADDSVKVTLAVDADRPIPADARAAIVAPSLISGRFVQLAPVFTGGDRLEDGATIGVDRTAVPVSFDDVKRQLTDLASALGPVRGRSGGVLSTTIAALDRSLRRGNADSLRTAIVALRDAASALSDGRSDIFSTIENLDSFTRNLAVNDMAVRGFVRELDTVGATLSANRSVLRGAVRGLARALGLTEQYLGRHRGPLTDALEDLNLLTAALADRSNELAGVLHVGPHALFDVHNSLENEAITAQLTATNLDNAAQLVCGLLLGVGASSATCQEAIGPLLDLLGLAPGGAR